ncbi:SBBP repeat-containing protein [Hymenobacter jeollabukensis]|uniref:T9SS type A sorting domain-containing protein n=1 Tax=Hymenobacter jeollabukensis TaxID=2025313 RepID=A0A5R8WSM2_9BACT|nr:SBBP repeat-containing protein [Hymenobacter jeollabukensis]TLM94185.1 T9SS type A sorting domain-containing protein [Hymenobacter jeollabukensis]
MSTVVRHLLRHLPVALLGLSSALPARAQTQTAPAWSTAQSVGRAARHAVLDAAGNTYHWGTFFPSTTIGGTTLTSRGDTDSFVAKYSPTGALLWLRQLGSTGYDEAVDLTVDAAGNVYVTGIVGGALDFGGATVTATNRQGFLMRYNAQGTATWAQLISSPDVKRVRHDGNGHVFVVGNFTGTVGLGGTTVSAPAGSVLHYFLGRFSEAGSLDWALPVFGYLNAGNVAYRDVHLALAPGGALYLAADFDVAPTVGSTTLAPRGLQDAMLTRISAQGQPEWVRQFGGTGREVVAGLCCDAAGNAYLAGSFTTPFAVGSTTLTGAGLTDAYLAKVAPDGSPLWAQSGGGPSVDYFIGLTVDAAGNAYPTGSFYDTAQFGTATLTGDPSHTCASVVAYSPQGQVRWAQQSGGGGTSAGYSISQSSAGDLQVFGSMSAGTVSFGPLAVTPSVAEFFTARLNGAALATKTGASVQPLPLYPNPATEDVQLPLAAGTTVQLIDARGRVVRTQLVTTGPVSVRDLAPGLYTLRATDARGQQYGARLVVQ